MTDDPSEDASPREEDASKDPSPPATRKLAAGPCEGPPRRLGAGPPRSAGRGALAVLVLLGVLAAATAVLELTRSPLTPALAPDPNPRSQLHSDPSPPASFGS